MPWWPILKIGWRCDRCGWRVVPEASSLLICFQRRYLGIYFRCDLRRVSAHDRIRLRPQQRAVAYLGHLDVEHLLRSISADGAAKNVSRMVRLPSLQHRFQIAASDGFLAQANATVVRHR